MLSVFERLDLALRLYFLNKKETRSASWEDTELGFEKIHELKKLDETYKFEAVCSKAYMTDKR
ncbi:hypothetical protein CWC33_06055 [Idiomarina sp. X4]|nr:hypothetical protein CWC33_06055 [Idiomarina sp. X4]